MHEPQGTQRPNATTTYNSPKKKKTLADTLRETGTRTKEAGIITDEVRQRLAAKRTLEADDAPGCSGRGTQGTQHNKAAKVISGG